MRSFHGGPDDDEAYDVNRNNGITDQLDRSVLCPASHQIIKDSTEDAAEDSRLEAKNERDQVFKEQRTSSETAEATRETHAVIKSKKRLGGCFCGGITSSPA